MKNPNELSATSSWRGNELQLIEQKANIVVGVANSRTRLRIGVLLSKYSEYQVDYISSESETGKLIEEADLIIGAGITAYEGVLRRKPVIVVGDYGLVEAWSLRIHSASIITIGLEERLMVQEVNLSHWRI